VSNGYLPKKALFYSEPPRFWNSETPYSESTYVIYPLSEDRLICLEILGEYVNDNGVRRLIFRPEINTTIRDHVSPIKGDEKR
jgi:hypothetical protein